jgi:Arc/MetJ-type ribon-helix-helix transcriptional regulator
VGKSSLASMVRTPVSVTLSRTCLNWIDRKVESRVYANRSHAIEVIVLEAMKNEREV